MYLRKKGERKRKCKDGSPKPGRSLIGSKKRKKAALAEAQKQKAEWREMRSNRTEGIKSPGLSVLDF